MPAILKVLENAIKKTLCFASKEDAERFKSFTNIYMEESGAGNGYEAYWVMFNSKIVEVDDALDSYDKRVKKSLLSSMMDSIVGTRTAGKDTSYYPAITVGLNNGITFNIQELPDKQRPGAGDMFRTLFSQGAETKFEGRVIKDNGDTLEVIDWYSEDDEGNPKVDAETICIEASKVMKIDDWLTRHRNS